MKNLNQVWFWLKPSYLSTQTKLIVYSSLRVERSETKQSQYFEIASLSLAMTQIILPTCLLTTLLTLFFPITHVTAEDSIPIEALDVTGNNFPQTQTLDPIKAEEILPVNRGTATSQGELLAPAPFQNNIIRNFEWTKRVPLDQLSQPIKVTYSLKGYNEQENLFSNQSNPRSTVNVVLKDEKSELLFRDNERNIAVIQGSVQFVLDPSRARAGKHGGKLSVCILSRSGGCL